MSDGEVEDRKTRLIRWTVIEDSAKSYEAKIRELKRFSNVMGMQSCDFKTLELFLVGIQADGFSASVGTTLGNFSESWMGKSVPELKRKKIRPCWMVGPTGVMSSIKHREEF